MSSGLLNASLQCQLLHIPLLKSLFLALFPIHVCLLISKLAEFPYKGLLLLLSCLFASVTLHTHFLSHSFSDAVLLFLSPLASLTLTSFIIREMQIKTTRRYHLVPIGWATIKKTENNKCWQRGGKMGTLMHYLWECKWSHCGKKYDSPSKD